MRTNKNPVTFVGLALWSVPFVLWFAAYLWRQMGRESYIGWLMVTIALDLVVIWAMIWLYKKRTNQKKQAQGVSGMSELGDPTEVDPNETKQINLNI